MSSKLRIAIVGDFDGRPSHIATQNALAHSAEKLQMQVEFQWIPTVSFESGVQAIADFDGIWGAPGSPYKSMNGAINAIRFAREIGCPYLGTCGGFQHAVVEYGANVLGFDALKTPDFDLYAPNDYISELSCSLVGQTRQIHINKDSSLYQIYGCTETEEKYNCDFGLNPSFQERLAAGGFKVVGTDETGEARIMLLEEHPFFIATLFQPQLSSALGQSHPLIDAYLTAAKKFSLIK